jgi:hypothetical protein
MPNVILFKSIKENNLLSKIANAESNKEKKDAQNELNRFKVFLNFTPKQQLRRINYYFPIINSKTNKI